MNSKLIIFWSNLIKMHKIMSTIEVIKSLNMVYKILEVKILFTFKIQNPLSIMLKYRRSKNRLLIKEMIHHTTLFIIRWKMRKYRNQENEYLVKITHQLDLLLENKMRIDLPHPHVTCLNTELDSWIVKLMISRQIMMVQLENNNTIIKLI